MKSKSKQVYQRQTKLVRLDAELCRLLKIKAAKSGISIKTLLEGYLAELLAVENQ